MVRCLRLLVAVIGAVALTKPDAVTAQCTGDCDGDGAVGISELITGVNLALGLADIAQCAAFDRDGNQQVGVTELVAAVNAALGNCQGAIRVTDFVSGVQTVGADVDGVVRAGAIPAPSGGPAVAVPDELTVINGGSAQLTLDAAQAFATAYV